MQYNWFTVSPGKSVRLNNKDGKLGFFYCEMLRANNTFLPWTWGRMYKPKFKCGWAYISEHTTSVTTGAHNMSHSRTVREVKFHPGSVEAYVFDNSFATISKNSFEPNETDLPGYYIVAEGITCEKPDASNKVLFFFDIGRYSLHR